MMNFSVEKVEYAIRKLGMWIYILPALYFLWLIYTFRVTNGMKKWTYEKLMLYIELKCFECWDYCL
jgi:hypothetical protein